MDISDRRQATARNLSSTLDKTKYKAGQSRCNL